MPTATSPRAIACWRRWPTPEKGNDDGFRHRPAHGGGFLEGRASEAEELGFTHAWFYDTQMLSADCFVAMGAAAVNTRRIRLGTGVLVPSNRIAPVAANALATLNQLAPGRIDFGVGTGFTARRAMGFGAIKVKDMETYIHQVYGLLRRETVEFEMEGQKKKIRFLNPELPLFNTKDPIALHLSAFGPRTRALTAKLKAGWIDFVGKVENGIKEVEAMREAWTQGGPCDRRPAGHRLRAGLRAEGRRARQLRARHGAGRPARRRDAASRGRRGAGWPASRAWPCCRRRRSRPISSWRAASSPRTRPISRTIAGI